MNVSIEGCATKLQQTDEHESDEGDATGNSALTEEDLNAKKKAAKKKRKQAAAKRKKAQATDTNASNTTTSSLLSNCDSLESTIPTRMDGLQSAFPNNPMHAYFNDNDNSSQLAFSRTKGRHVVATRQIPAGHTIFRMNAYAAVVHDAYVRDFCHCCFQHAANLSVCSSCRYVRFCSAKCKNALSSIHNFECDALSRLKSLGMEGESASVRLFIRICYLQHQETIANEKKAKSKPGQSFADCLSLISHFEDQSTEAKMHVLMLLKDLQRRVFQDEAIWRNGELNFQTCMKIMFQIQCNAHHMTEINKLKIGLGLFIPACYLNHSCDPNCVYWFDENGKMVLQSIRPIAVGEEITYSYIDLYQPRDFRSLLLRKVFFIQECQCDRCSKTAEKVHTDMLMRAMICSSCGTNPLIEYKDACETGKIPLSASKPHFLKYDKSNTGSMYCPTPQCGKMYKKGDIDEWIHNVQLLSHQASLLAHGGAQSEAVRLLEQGVLYIAKPASAPVSSSTTSSVHHTPFFHPYHYALFNTYLHLVSILTSIPDPSIEDSIRTLHYLSPVLECLSTQGFEHHPEAADALKLKGDVFMILAMHSRNNKEMRLRESPPLVRTKLSGTGEVIAGLQALSFTSTASPSTTTAASNTLMTALPIVSSLPDAAFKCYSASLSLRTLIYGKAHPLTKSVDAKIAEVEKAYGKMKPSRVASESSSDLPDLDFDDAKGVTNKGQKKLKK